MLLAVAEVDTKTTIQSSDRRNIQTLKLTIYIRSAIALGIGKAITLSIGEVIAIISRSSQIMITTAKTPAHSCFLR